MVWAAGARRGWRYNKEVRRKRENQRVQSAGAAVARAPTPALRSMTWTSFDSPEACVPVTPALLQNGGNVGIGQSISCLQWHYKKKRCTYLQLWK